MTDGTAIDRVGTLRRSPVFDQLSPAELEVLANLCRPCQFAAGQVIFTQGDLGDSLYVIAAGEVEISRQEREGVPLAVLPPGACFGEMALIDREDRSATARARTAVTALQLSAEGFTTFRSYSRDGFTFMVINVARVLSSRLRETSALLAARL
jgi:CRP/FNR family cyclic AMP-dependent transcriptional regulator